MAQSMNLKPFYAALGVILVAGVAWMLNVRSTSSVITLPEMVNAPAYPGYAIGSDSAPVEVIEYADFQCPACAMFAILTAPDVKSQLVNTGRIRWVFRDYPLPIHDRAPIAHLAAACAGEQGRFWAMHDQLFYSQGAWVQDRRPRKLFDTYAQAIGVDVQEFGECMDEERHVERIAATRYEGQQLGVGSTPSFIIGDQLIAGSISIDRFIQLVERAEQAAARQ